jgi:hypothetical protein
MIERLRPHRSDVRAAPPGLPRPPYRDGRRAPTVHVPPPPRPPATNDPSLLGFAAEFDQEADQDPDGEPAARAGTRAAVELVVHRRADPVAGTALVLAGLAGNVSLWLRWVVDDGDIGIALVRRGLGAVDAGVGELLRSGLWEPVAIVLGAGLLVLLGMLLFVPAHTHRLIGVLALVVALTVSAAVVSLLAGAEWTLARLEAGLWTGVAVAVFGLVGAFKAMLTGPLVTAAGREDQLRR